MKKICVCGAFRLWDIPKGGQEIKTCIIANCLEKMYGEIYRIDTIAKHSRIKMPFQLFWAMLTCNDIVILPAHKGVIVLSKLLVLLNSIFNRRLHYSVIGGWLQDLLPHYPEVKSALKKFTGIYVETKTMMVALNKLGLYNVYVVPNCKPLSIISAHNLPMFYSEPYKLVTFSRVTEKKGIKTAADVVNTINRKYGRTVFSLDIYGPCDFEDIEWFEKLKNSFTSEIQYKGNAPFNKSVEILSDYFALLFPTKYYTEGIPGTLIDAYAAGIPVIAARWKSFEDVVIDGKTGLGYEFDNIVELTELLDEISKNPLKLVAMKEECIKTAEQYLPENAIIPILKKMKRL